MLGDPLPHSHRCHRRCVPTTAATADSGSKPLPSARECSLNTLSMTAFGSPLNAGGGWDDVDPAALPRPAVVAAEAQAFASRAAARGGRLLSAEVVPAAKASALGNCDGSEAWSFLGGWRSAAYARAKSGCQGPASPPCAAGCCRQLAA